MVFGIIGDGTNNTQHNFPGYCNQWDQMLYRDVRVANGGSLTVSFLYETQLDPRNSTAAATCKGWFDKDPLSLQQGGSGFGASNFISSSAYLGTPAASGPVDSFMVYVGVPTDPTLTQYTDGGSPRPIFDLQRRWFSEVLKIDAPYKEILSTMGRDSVYNVLAVQLHGEQHGAAADAGRAGRGGPRWRDPHRVPQQDQRELRG